MSYRLATIVTDAPLEFDPADNLRRPAKPELYQVFLRLEFNKLIEKMGQLIRASPSPSASFLRAAGLASASGMAS